MRLKSKKKEASETQDSRLNDRFAPIRSLIQDDNVLEAISQFQTLTEERGGSFSNELIGLQARLRRVTKDELEGLTSWAEAHAEKNRITQSLLQLLDQIDARPATHGPLRELSAAEKKRRAGYLQDLKADVENRLRVSIHHARLIDLGIDDTPSATHLPWIYTDVESKHDFKDYQEAFVTYRRRMLLLGAPGSGKTITLLHIAQQLINEAEQNDHAPIPLLVNLSKFQPNIPQSRLLGFLASKRGETSSTDKRIERWLATEFTANPFISVDIAKTWIEEGRIAALLDGLDEVNDEHRAELVQILNATYLKDHPDAAVVVCSRINEYRPLQDREETRVGLKGAITLQPLTRPKILQYLEVAQATGLRDSLLNDQTLYQMAQTPLILSMMTLAYGGLGPAGLPSDRSSTERRHHMMDAYVAKMLQRKERRDRQLQFDENRTRDVPVKDYAYRPATINSLLGWLAVRMSVRMQTAISLDRLYSFLTRGIERDRQAGIWWATALARAPVVFMAALLAGLAIAPLTKQGWLQVLFISLLAALLFLPTLWVVRSFEDDAYDKELTAWDLIKRGLLIAATIPALIGTLGIAAWSLSSVLPFGIPPLPTTIIAICLNIALIVFFIDSSTENDTWIFTIGTFAFFAIAVFVMIATRSQYGWYLPATSLLAFQVLAAAESGRRQGGWRQALREGGGVIAGIVAVLAITLLGIKVVEGFPWFGPLISYALVVVTIAVATPSNLLPVIGLLVSFILGAVLGGDRGAIVAALLYGHLWMFGFFIVDEYGAANNYPQRLEDLMERLIDYFDGIADRYLFSPALLRILAVSRCLPLRSRRFFEYTEQALLLKRSAGDIEFMHRLLRDYFALRDLQPLLTSTDSNRRLQAIRSLGFQGDAAIDALAEFVRSGDPSVREAAASALGRVVSPVTVTHIEVALNDAVPKVRRAAVFSLKNLTLEEQHRLLPRVINDLDLSVQRAVLEVIFSSYLSSFDFIQDIVVNLGERPELRQVVFDWVGNNRTPKKVRSGALSLPYRLRDPKSVPYLISALNDRNFANRREVPRVLARFDDERAVRALENGLSDRSKEMRIAVRKALDNRRWLNDLGGDFYS